MPPGSPPLVGRADELGELRTALREAAGGRPGAIVLEGEPGVGKSRLLAEFLDGAQEDGATVLRGGCLDLGAGALPHLPLAEMLRTLVRRRGAARVRAMVDPAWPELARVLPSIGDGAVRPPAPAEGSPAQLLEAVLRLIEECAREAPTVLAVEDLHWVDRSSADLLVFLVRTLVDEPVLVVGTCRTHAAPVLRALLSDLTLSGRCRRRELDPLGPTAITELVRGLAGTEPEPALIRWIIERSDGNAYFARELLAARESRDDIVPLGVRDLIQVRLDAAGETARRVAVIVAGAGRPVAHPLVAAASGLPDADLLPALRACVTGGLLVVDDGQRYDFRHALARDAVYAELLPGERASCHRTLAEALAALPATALDDRASAAAELAHHWDRAGDPRQAALASVDAGVAASATRGYAEAEMQFERALRLWPATGPAPEMDIADLLASAADASRWAGHVEQALNHVERALVQVGLHAPPARIGELQERRGRFLWELGRPDDSLRAYERAGAAFADEPPSAAKAWVLAGHATALVQAGRLHDALDRSEEALDVAEQAGAQAEAGRAMNTRGAALALLGEPEEGIDALRKAVRIAQESGNLEDQLRGHANLGFALETAGRLEEALEATLEGVRRSRDLGLAATGGAVMLANAASVLTMLGRWDEAEEIADSAGESRPPPGFERYLHLVLAELDVGRGRFAEAEERLAPVSEALRAEPQLAGLLHAVRAEAQLWQRRPAAALALVGRGLDAVAGSDDPGQVLRLCVLGLRAVADAVAPGGDASGPLGDPGGARRRLRDRAAEAGAARLLPAAAAQRNLCDAEGLRFDGSDEPGTWAEIAAGWDALAQPYPAAYARRRQGEAVVAHHDRTAARGPLAAAREVAVRLGAAPLLAEIDAVARAARLDLAAPEPGATARTPATPFGLTSRERDVVALLGEGLTNRQIARKLFITEKTAGVHVSNILRKMGVANRGQAAAAARRAGL